MPDGYFYVYSYEAPVPVILTAAKAVALHARHYTAGYEVVAECEGRLHPGDALILMSDGVTQSGMGHGYGLGIGSDGVAEIINREITNHSNGFNDAQLYALPELVAKHCASLAEGRYEDDATLALLHCRKAAELTLLTGPPSHAMLDKKFAELILNRDAGTKVVCGSTTLDIISRELNEKTEVIPGSASFGAPPEYKLAGVDLAVEGSVTLNQVCNIIDEPIELFEEENVVQRLCLMLRESDVIHLHIGMAANHAHESIFFKQVGVRLRRMAVERLTRKLRAMGKLVTENYY
jgi:hypothetical protein